MSFRVFSSLLGSFWVFSCLFVSSRVVLGLFGNFWVFSGLVDINKCPNTLIVIAKILAKPIVKNRNNTRRVF